MNINSMLLNSFENHRSLPIIVCMSVLFVIHLVIFWDHYFNEIGVPLDFSKAYYARIAFGLTMISQGIFPEWIPFQQMGYPLSMHPQFGLLYYPFSWVFPIFGIAYTLQNAIIFQNLHIFAGSIGMFFFLNSIVKSHRIALLGAIGFQFFGGFFSNAPYPDMIRAYALSPWMFYFFTLNMEKLTISKRTLLIPLVIFLMTVGSYPGHFIASIFMMSLFIIFQTLNGFRLHFGKSKNLLRTVILFGLVFLGLGMSVIYLGPFLDFGEELKRVDNEQFKKLDNNSFRYQNFYHSFLRLVSPEHLGFSAGLYVGLPILIFSSFVPLSFLKRYWMFLAIFSIGILMIIENSFFYKTIILLIPPLGFTRRTIAEYGVYVVIPIFIFAMLGLKSLTEKISLKTFIIRTIFVISWFSYGIHLLYSSKKIWTQIEPEIIFQRIEISIVILIITILVIGLFVVKSKISNHALIKKSSFFSVILIIIFSSLILVDGFVTINDNPRWRLDPADNLYEKFGFQLEQNGDLVTYDILENLPEKRSIRENRWLSEHFAWQGYLDGSYIVHDLATILLQRGDDAFKNPTYKSFMRASWSPIFLDSPKTELMTISIPESVFDKSSFNNQPKTWVTQTNYGINDVLYNVSLKESTLMVENEIYFSGWMAELYFSDHNEELVPIEVNEIFRGWILPAGDYQMKASFHFPNSEKYQIISLSIFIIWIAILIIFIFRKSNGLFIRK